jgi:hypothetical protein
MNRMIVGVLGLVGLMSGCAWFAANEKTISSDSLALVQCVVQAAEAGTTAEVIAGAVCGPMLVSDVISILEATNTSVVSSPATVAAVAAHPTLKVRPAPAGVK